MALPHAAVDVDILLVQELAEQDVAFLVEQEFGCLPESIHILENRHCLLLAGLVHAWRACKMVFLGRSLADSFVQCRLYVAVQGDKRAVFQVQLWVELDVAFVVVDG